MEHQSEESRFIHLFFAILLCLILCICTMGLLFLSSCQYVPEIAKDVDDIATDNAIRVEISRETFQKDTDLDINIQVNNKDKEVK